MLLNNLSAANPSTYYHAGGVSLWEDQAAGVYHSGYVSKISSLGSRGEWKRFMNSFHRTAPSRIELERV